MAKVKDDRGYNQGFELVASTEVRMRRRADYMVSKMEPGRRDVLEIGCGRGEVSYWIAQKTGMNILGTDLCVPFIEDAKVKLILPNLNYEVLDFNKPGDIQGREKFDYIVGNGILHHLYYHLDDALARLHSLLRDSGKIIFLEPNIYNPYCAVIFNFARRWARLEPDEMAFSKSFISVKLSKAGFRKVDVEYKDFLLPGIAKTLIKPSIVAGNILEKVPLVKMVSQSIYIVAEK